MFDKADKDGDGKLTKEEWYNVLNSSGCHTSMWVTATADFVITFATQERSDGVL